MRGRSGGAGEIELSRICFGVSGLANIMPSSTFCRMRGDLRYWCQRIICSFALIGACLGGRRFDTSLKTSVWNRVYWRSNSVGAELAHTCDEDA